MIDLYNEDCIETIKKIKNDSVDLIITSPPYDDLREYGKLDSWNENKWKGVIDNLYNILKIGGVVVWIVNDSVVKGSETGSSFKQALYFKEIGFNIHDTMIWKKSNFSNPSKTRYHQTFEYMFVFSKGSPKTVNLISDRKNVYGGKIGNYGKNTVTQTDGSKTERPRKINTEYGIRHNVWEHKTSGQIGESRKFKHPAMFPYSLVKDHVITWSNEGDLIYDPFMGSGTTGVVCKDFNRNFIGSEINIDFYNIAIDRIGVKC